MNQLDNALDILQNHLPEIDDAFVDINWGGCGVMAELIAEQLDLLCVDYQVACKGGDDFRSGSFKTIEEVNKSIDEYDKPRIPRSHILIKVDGRYFDSEGEQFPDKDLITALIDRDTIARMNNISCWNSQFDRDQVSGMRVFTGKVFRRANNNG